MVKQIYSEKLKIFDHELCNHYTFVAILKNRGGLANLRQSIVLCHVQYFCSSSLGSLIFTKKKLFYQHIFNYNNYKFLEF